VALKPKQFKPGQTHSLAQGESLERWTGSDSVEQGVMQDNRQISPHFKQNRGKGEHSI
jgi:hypothetical protein